MNLTFGRLKDVSSNTGVIAITTPELVRRLFTKTVDLPPWIKTLHQVEIRGFSQSPADSDHLCVWIDGLVPEAIIHCETPHKEEADCFAILPSGLNTDSTGENSNWLQQNRFKMLDCAPVPLARGILDPNSLTQQLRKLRITVRQRQYEAASDSHVLVPPLVASLWLRLLVSP